MSSWLQQLRRPGAKAAAAGKDRLLCWPHAGGSAAAFAPFAAALPEFDVYAVQPPGRGTRLFEPTVTDPDEALREVLAALAELPGDGHLVVLGHSMGAAMAHLLATRAADVDLLVLSAWSVSKRHPAIGTDRAELLDFMRWLDSPGLDGLDEEDIVEHLLPPLAADLAVFEALSRRLDDGWADTPTMVVAAGGDPAIRPEDAFACREVLDVRAEISLPGGHFAVFDHAGPVASGIREALAGLSAKEQ